MADRIIKYNDKLLRWNGEFIRTEVVIPSIVFVSATGGTVTTDGDYKIHTFTTNGNFIVSVGGDVSALIVGGGGSGGFANSAVSSGGGGGGNAIESSIQLYSGTYQIIVGRGGIATVDGVENGFKSIAFGIEASGGFAGVYGGVGGKSGSGYAGGSNQDIEAGCGGGGATGIGGSAVYQLPGFRYGGNGGTGLKSSISGTLIGYAGGGAGGGSNGGGTVVDGGGNSGSPGVRGGGGGGRYRHSLPIIPVGNGGNGIVIIRYKYQ